MTLLPCRPGENRAHIFFVGTVCATVHFAARAAYFTAGVYTKRQSKSEADAKWYVKCTFESAIALVGFGTSTARFGFNGLAGLEGVEGRLVRHHAAGPVLFCCLFLC